MLFSDILRKADTAAPLLGLGLMLEVKKSRESPVNSSPIRGGEPVGSKN